MPYICTKQAYPAEHDCFHQWPETIILQSHPCKGHMEEAFQS